MTPHNVNNVATGNRLIRVIMEMMPVDKITSNKVAIRTDSCMDRSVAKSRVFRITYCC